MKANFTAFLVGISIAASAQTAAPPVCIRYDIRNFEDEIWANAQDIRVYMLEPVPMYSWHSKLKIRNENYDFGNLTGLTFLSVESIFGRMVVKGEVDFNYHHNNGAWAFFNSNIGSRLAAGPYLRGPGFVPYEWKATLVANWQTGSSAGYGFPGSGAAAIWEGIGTILHWPYSSTPKEASGSGMTVLNWGSWNAYDTVYWPSYHWTDYNLGASFGNTGPNLPAFAVVGNLKMTYVFEIYIKQGVAPFTASNIRPAATEEHYIFAGAHRFTSSSFDPDNPGNAFRRGILADQWTLNLPDGSSTSFIGPCFSVNMNQLGRYLLSQRSFDDEGMSTERIYKIMVVPQPQQPGGEASVGTDG